MIYQLISLLTQAAFYGCYFLKSYQQKKRGIKTDQIGKGKTGFIKYIEITMKTTAILVFTAGLISIFLNTKPVHTVIRITGAIFSVAGTLIFITAVRTMRDSWRAGVSKTGQTELITDGIYQISRNPAFLGFDLLYIGTLLMFFNWILCILTFFSVIMYHLQIVNVEEDFLLNAFGDTYLQYRKKVCRYLGRKK